MGFLSNLGSSIVKTALTPLAMAKDAKNVLEGKEVEATKDLLKSAVNDAKESANDLAEGDL